MAATKFGNHPYRLAGYVERVVPLGNAAVPTGAAPYFPFGSNSKRGHPIFHVVPLKLYDYPYQGHPVILVVILL